MTTAPDPVDLGGFTFDPASGELKRRGPDELCHVRRLSPQPAKLLALLAERPGEVVTREEIHTILWPDVHVDYDQGLHFCVRQVREAIEAVGADPRCIENLPRRGYRLRVASRKNGRRTTSRSLGRRRGAWWAAGVALGAVLLLVGFWVVGSRRPPAEKPATFPVTIAVLPFRPPPEAPALPGHDVIAEWVLLGLDSAAGARFSLIGPTTTGAYADHSEDLRRLILELDPNYVIHGRYLVEADGTRLLGELIRATDGAHVWVESFDDLDDPEAIADTIADGVTKTLVDLPR